MRRVKSYDAREEPEADATEYLTERGDPPGTLHEGSAIEHASTRSALGAPRDPKYSPCSTASAASSTSGGSSWVNVVPVSTWDASWTR